MIKLDLNPPQHVVKQFAWVAVVGMGLLAYLVLNLTVGFAWDHPAFLTAIGIGVVQLVLFLAGVSVLSRMLFIVLSVAFVRVGFVLSHVLLMVVYYLVLTPIALVMRIGGRDVIGKKLDANKQSYWHERDADRPKASYFKLY